MTYRIMIIPCRKKINIIDIWSYIFLDKSDLNSVRDCMRFVTFHRTLVGSLQKSTLMTAYYVDVPSPRSADAIEGTSMVTKTDLAIIQFIWLLNITSDVTLSTAMRTSVVM